MPITNEWNALGLELSISWRIEIYRKIPSECFKIGI